VHAFTLLNGQDQEKIMPVQVMGQVGIPRKFLHPPDFELSGCSLHPLLWAELPDGDFFHHVS
jgi:hypothetical protein